MSRAPAVANMFYPGDRGRLKEQLNAFVRPVPEPKKVLAAISPHAGYVYSGGVAGAVFSQIQIPGTVVILGPNHRGMGAAVAITASGTWDMPLGPVPINEALAESILKVSTSGIKIKDDPQAHTMEHSIEVQVPFLQFLQPDVSIVPIALSHLSYDACQEMGRALVRGIRDYKKDVLLVASTDMTHYESQESAQAKDKLAMDRILELDPEGLYETVAQHGISMCGVIPTTIVLEACNGLGASKAALVQYATSGDVTGDYAQVVGYAGLIVY
ncbi:MAG: AmmeMemoRadiSam system protein B [Deltaproteobacteria bacterium]|nr:AmmeMemoRadiSam system protein B [Deltaproteobacteria bacterium]MBW2018872.1 AmmeMemoRadiSam system protein B [Deltaproteobacteria bacterium]MBW2073627.1 AmmeMemoRadiSam system protein B [Deltaproteobacteria bacterium]